MDSFVIVKEVNEMVYLEYILYELRRRNEIKFHHNAILQWGIIPHFMPFRKLQFIQNLLSMHHSTTIIIRTFSVLR